MSVSSTVLFSMPVRIREASVDRSAQWLAAGWRDFVRAPGVSLAYGAGFVAVSFLLTVGLIAVGLGSLVPPLLGGFLLIAPLLVAGLYDVSRRLERGDPVTLAGALTAARGMTVRLGWMGVVLMIFFMAWLLIALVIFAMFFSQTPPPLDRFVIDVVFSLRGAAFLFVGTLAGALLAGTVFMITAVSVPMLADRDLDVVTAIYVSIKTAQTNWQVMVGWAAMIGVVSAVGIATFFVGLAVAMPLLAYATWHAYRDLIDSDGGAPTNA